MPKLAYGNDSLRAHGRDANIPGRLRSLFSASTHGCLLPKAGAMYNEWRSQRHLKKSIIMEYYWAWVKRYFRGRRDENLENPKKLFQGSLSAPPNQTLFRRSFRYASVYRLGQ
jgi:hypothetical protein